MLIWSLVPIYWALKTSLQTEADARAQNYVPLHPTLGNYATLLTRSGELPGQIRRSTLNIVVECGAATIVTVVLATLAAYAFARMTFRGRNVLFYAVLATMAFPAYTTLIPLYRIMSDFRLVNTYTGIVLVYVSGFLPLATWVLHNYFANLPVSHRGGRPGRRREPAAGAAPHRAAAGPAGHHLDRPHHVPVRLGPVPVPPGAVDATPRRSR